MGSKINAILELEVPVIVLLGERQMRLSEILSLTPGAIIELTKDAEDPLELMVNNKQIGTGSAVKVGENFGIRVTQVGDLKDRILAMGSPEKADEAAAAGAEAGNESGGGEGAGGGGGGGGEMTADEAAEAAMLAMLAGQGT